MNILRAVARPLVALPFIIDGWSALTKPQPHVQRVQDSGLLPEDLSSLGLPDDQILTTGARVMGGVSVAAGVSLALGRFPRSSAAILAAISVPTALVNAPAWKAKNSEQQRHITAELGRRGALTGALILAAFDRQGKPSAAWRYSQWRQHRAAVAEARQIERARFTDAA